MPARDASPSGQAAANEQRLQLAEVLERLPDDYRQVILLRNIEELSHEQIAERMGRSVGAVRNKASSKMARSFITGPQQSVRNRAGKFATKNQEMSSDEVSR